MHPLAILPFLVLPIYSFNLDTKAPYWGYTTASLATSTSRQCKDAYSAEINCDEFLLALLYANEDRHYLPAMEPSNFTDTCTSTCHSSLTKYIENVEESCSEPTDAALKGVGHWGEMEFKQVPVVTIGRILEYTLMRSCAEDEDGENCYITQDTSFPTEPSCTWTCAIAWWWNQHEYPYSEWEFKTPEERGYDDLEDGTWQPLTNHTDVLVQHAVLASLMDQAWQTVQNCGFGNGSVPFNMGIEGVEAVAVSSGVTSSKSGSTDGSESVSVSESGGSFNGTASSSDPGDDDAERLGFARGWIVLMVLVLSFLIT
ncbi:hypothetical protein BDV12DRAFT_197608 [Aspergillus spectabilis]